MEKLALALVHATRKLPHYFQAYTVYVLTKCPLQSLLKRSSFTGRIAKQRTRLGSFDIWYRPRSLVKGQILADFVSEFTPRGDQRVMCNVEARPQRVFVDSEFSVMVSGAGIVMISP